MTNFKVGKVMSTAGLTLDFSSNGAETLYGADGATRVGYN
jgi:hypothetical protein